MRTYPHRPDQEALQDIFAAAQARLLRKGGRTPDILRTKSLRFWKLNVQTALDCACLAYAFEHDTALVKDYLREALDCCADGLAVEAPFSTAEISALLSAALILGDEARLATLCSLPPERYSSPGTEVPELVLLAFRVYAALAMRRVNEAARLCADIDAVRAGIKLPRQITAVTDPILEAERRLLEGDANGMQSALEAYLAANIKRFQSPALNNFPAGLLDLQGLGLICLARREGLDLATESVYWPADLLPAP